MPPRQVAEVPAGRRRGRPRKNPVAESSQGRRPAQRLRLLQPFDARPNPETRSKVKLLEENPFESSRPVEKYEEMVKIQTQSFQDLSMLLQQLVNDQAQQKVILDQMVALAAATEKVNIAALAINDSMLNKVTQRGARIEKLGRVILANEEKVNYVDEAIADATEEQTYELQFQRNATEAYWSELQEKNEECNMLHMQRADAEAQLAWKTDHMERIKSDAEARGFRLVQPPEPQVPRLVPYPMGYGHWVWVPDEIPAFDDENNNNEEEDADVERTQADVWDLDSDEDEIMEDDEGSIGGSRMDERPFDTPGAELNHPESDALDRVSSELSDPPSSPSDFLPQSPLIDPEILMNAPRAVSGSSTAIPPGNSVASSSVGSATGLPAGHDAGSSANSASAEEAKHKKNPPGTSCVECRRFKHKCNRAAPGAKCDGCIKGNHDCMLPGSSIKAVEVGNAAKVTLKFRVPDAQQ